MLTPEEIERMPVKMEKLCNNLQLEIMRDIVRRMKLNNNTITRSADWQMNVINSIGANPESIKEYLSRELKTQMDEIYDDVIAKGYTRDENLYKATGKDFIPYKENKELQKLISAIKDQTLNSYSNITNTLGFIKVVNGKRMFTDLSKYYNETLDKAVADVVSGAFDYNTVLKKVVDQMTTSGLRTVDFASGRSLRIETATRTALMTGVNQVTSKISDENAKKLETDCFEVSYHSGARPSHQVWQGKVYTREELESVCGLGTVTGLCGANCYHSYDPFIPGISERKYTDKQLTEWKAKENKPIGYKGKEYTQYEALQRQRQLEAYIRKEKESIQLLKAGGADQELIDIEKMKYRQISNEYIEFSKKMDLPEQRDRLYIGKTLKRVG